MNNVPEVNGPLVAPLLFRNDRVGSRLLTKILDGSSLSELEYRTFRSGGKIAAVDVFMFEMSGTDTETTAISTASRTQYWRMR